LPNTFILLHELLRGWFLKTLSPPKAARRHFRDGLKKKLKTVLWILGNAELTSLIGCLEGKSCADLQISFGKIGIELVSPREIEWESRETTYWLLERSF